MCVLRCSCHDALFCKINIPTGLNLFGLCTESPTAKMVSSHSWCQKWDPAHSTEAMERAAGKQIEQVSESREGHQLIQGPRRRQSQWEGWRNGLRGGGLFSGDRQPRDQPMEEPARDQPVEEPARDQPWRRSQLETSVGGEDPHVCSREGGACCTSSSRKGADKRASGGKWGPSPQGASSSPEAQDFLHPMTVNKLHYFNQHERPESYK